MAARKKPDAVAEKIDDTPDEKASLVERIQWVRNRVTRLGKDSTVSSGGGRGYKAITHDKVTAFIRPKLVQAGIFCYLTCRESADHETGASTQSGRKIVQHRAKFEVFFENVHDHSDKITVTQVAYADDFGDKAPGKAQSYAMKYALLKMFMIETGEDDEERTADIEAQRVTLIGDDKNATVELYAVAEECFGDDADTMLMAMANRRFYVEDYKEIPMDRYQDAIKSLRIKARQEAEKDG